MLLLILLILPAVAAIKISLIGGKFSKYWALLASILQFGLTVYMWNQFVPTGGIQFSYYQNWIPEIGAGFSIGMDGICMLMVILTNLLVPLIILSTFNSDYKKPQYFYALILFMQSALVGVFVAQDAFLYYIFWELALVPIFFICLQWSDHPMRSRITMKFFVYTLFGSLLMLVAFIYIYVVAKTTSFAWQDVVNGAHSLSPHEQGLIFCALFIAFAIKMPVFPFHTWQPDTYDMAPAPGTMLLSGIMLKMGIFSLLRWLIPLVPEGVIQWKDTVIVLSVISVVYGSLIAIRQQEFKRLFAYSSIAHVGLICAGIFTMTTVGMQGGLIQMLSHGINVVGLFLVAQIIYSRTNLLDIKGTGGIIHKSPLFAGLFLVILLGSVALPLTNGFVGEFLLLNGLYEYNVWFAAVAGLTIIFGAVYMLKTYQWSILGEENPEMKPFTPLAWNETTVLVIICALILVLGVYPNLILDMTAPSVDKLVPHIDPTVLLQN